MKKIHICGEIGANHDRNFDQALKMIDICSKMGCDSAKFQTYSSETMYSKYTPDFDKYKNIPDLIKSIELPREWQKDLKEYCDSKNIEFISTPFDFNAVDELVELGVKRIKIASFEATDKVFVKYIGETKLPVIFSTGLMEDQEILRTISWLLESGCSNITVLHCISSYPTSNSDIQLWRIKHLKKIINYHFGDPSTSFEDLNWIKLGFSDHTLGTLASVLSVMEGVSFIEKHFTLSKYLSGPDHPFAIEPHELNELVQNIRKAEIMIGNKGEPRPSCEKEMKKASRSVIANSNLSKGHKILEKDLITKRPYLGEEYFHASEFYNLIGKTVKESIKEDEMIKKSSIE